MNRSEFRAYRGQFEKDCFELLRSRPAHTFDEQALPSYTHRNVLARWLFWQRIRHILRELERLRPKTVLDFGCGAGVLLRYLSASGTRVYACDLRLEVAREQARKHSWDNITWLESIRELEGLDPHRLDVIVALDVLEHVSASDLRDLSQKFSGLLKPSGRLLVSGPTESLGYRIGRSLAGFRGDYHVRNIYDIELELSTCFRLDLKARLYWPVTLFRIVSGAPLSLESGLQTPEPR